MVRVGQHCMSKNKTWGKVSHEKNSSLKVKLFLGAKRVSFCVSPIVLAFFLVGGLVSYKLANSEVMSERARLAARISELELKKDQLEVSLQHKEKEREHMVSLADARSEELWSELEDRDREISRLWKIVGEQRSSTKTSAHTPRRRALLGSRSGRGRSALAVKVGYNSLTNVIEDSEREIAALSKAATDYREKKIADYKAELESRTPSIWPCEGDLTSGFGNRIHPVYGYGKFHAGCDFTTPHGTPIQATAAGTVCHSGWMGGYGKVIEIDHGNGLKTLYAHCSELLVAKGSKVQKGQRVAKVGTTGLSSGPHCHYEVSVNKKQVDPKPYLKQKDAPKPIAKI